MGYLRLILSLMVVASHLAIYGAINQGVVAVCVFFLLSGYVMTALVDKHFSKPVKYGRFIVDRAMRLYPQYLAYMAMTWLLIAITNVETPFLSGLSPAMVALNLAIIPIGYSALFPALSNALIIPPAATLGLEFTFYLLFPFLLYFKARVPAMLLSFGVFLLAYAGLIDTDTFGYRLLPGTLFIFLIGSALRRRNRRETTVAAGVYAVSCFLLLLAEIDPKFKAGFSREVLFGTVVGTPILWALLGLKETSLDALAGNLSYGVFLNHFLLIWAFQSACIDPVSPSFAVACLFVASSLLLASITYFLIERPVIRARHHLRDKSRLVQLRHAAV